jgi:hypothetical protein
MSNSALIVHNVSSVKILDKESKRFSKSEIVKLKFSNWRFKTEKIDCYHDSYTASYIKNLPKYYYEKDGKVFIQEMLEINIIGGSQLLITSENPDLIQYGFDVITKKLEYTLDLSDYEIINKHLS